MCKVLKVSRSGYYEWLTREPSKRALANKKITHMIKAIYSESKGRYGSPKVTQVLLSHDIRISRPRVARIMRKNGLRSIVSKKYRICTTDSNHQYKISPNLLNRKFTAKESGTVWASDITYIPTQTGWKYLTAVMDLFDRKIIGWSISRSMATEATTLKALRMAIKNRTVKPNAIFHSDRGIQYASDLFRKELAKYKFEQSMSRKGNCWDNAVSESFFKSLKTELINQKSLYDPAKSDILLFEYIEIWYNRKRLHQSLGYKTPEQFGKINQLKAA